MYMKPVALSAVAPSLQWRASEHELSAVIQRQFGDLRFEAKKIPTAP
jgi:hypothetical protein